MLNRLTDSLDFQGRALTLRGDRQRLIASNIANADTPGYVAREMDFATALREASGSAAGSATKLRPTVAAPATLSTTQRGHIAANTGSVGGPGGLGADAGLLYATASQTSLDRNTVDMDRERASFADNTIKAEAALRFINGQVRTALDAIKGQ